MIKNIFDKTDGIYDDEAEIDIIVDSDYQKQGLGKLLSVTFIKNCLKRNLIPKWDCYKYNDGSVKLAESLGFKVINEYPCNLINRVVRKLQFQNNFLIKIAFSQPLGEKMQDLLENQPGFRTSPICKNKKPCAAAGFFAS